MVELTGEGGTDRRRRRRVEGLRRRERRFRSEGKEAEGNGVKEGGLGAEEGKGAEESVWEKQNECKSSRLE